jgi:hypothetical protein
VTVVAAASAAVIAGLTMRDVYGVRAWWSVVLFLSITPAWFLHTRTALETGVAVSLWCWFVCLFLRFRTGGSRANLYAAVACAALAFYAYSPMALVVPVTAALFVVCDLRFVRAHASTFVRAGVLAAVLALPELRFQLAHAGETTQHLHALGSYWTDPDLGLPAKAEHFGRIYASALDPRYWYSPHETRDLTRHVMAGYGHLLAVTLPLTLVGIGRALRRIAEARYRLLLAATLAAPVGAATVEATIPRVLTLVVPAALFASLGVAALLQLLDERESAIVAVLTAVLLFVANVAMLRDALAHGGTWSHDYGLYGMQWGGREVSAAITDDLQRYPSDEVVLSPSWANGADTLVRFFLPNEPRIRLAGPDLVLTTLYPEIASTLLVLPPAEYARVRMSPKLVDVRTDRIIRWPDGRPGFYFVRAGYSERAGELIRRERAAVRRPVSERIVLDGVPTTIAHSRFDAGTLADLFDSDTFTSARTADAYPMVLRLSFARPRTVRAVRLRGGDDGRDLRVFTGGGSWTDTAPDADGTFEVQLDQRAGAIRTLTIRYRDTPGETPSHVHAFELDLG